MTSDKGELQAYYMTCKSYFSELRKKGFDYWFSAYYSALKTKSGPILDLGCGVGQVVNRLAAEGFFAVGVDVSPIGVKMASKQGCGFFVVAHLRNINLQDNLDSHTARGGRPWKRAISMRGQK